MRLTVEVLEEGVHSGDASGVVPDSFRLARALLSRVEDAATGQVLPAPCSVAIPADRVRQAKVAAQALGEGAWTKFPFAGGTQPPTRDIVELVLNRTWRPTLTVIAQPTALPKPGDAGNVLRPSTIAGSSASACRPPPTRRPATRRLGRPSPPTRRRAPRVSYVCAGAATGWNARAAGAM